jgi:2-oxoglutarate ferredoxin oxidoreductase subunit gamma
MKDRIEIRLGGSGGQGLILGGIILAEAAILDGKNAIQAQSYGPEARGGASKAEVIIADGEIAFPKVQNADVLLALTQKACDKYLSSLK